ncbi:MAG: PrsW family intramembrane metalloprotease [Pegethrix bostrychoides GSE-TBD4-15B]|uniref:PrsW family intramembrane metalloprotease n=1 Tax=Pegethrix bostrychoides GSE-TBD4-15B TaxID=2839662 RepID=A0A951P9E3_9CYAN|nr:PrsW family intramembrane metalloprotease [Pegethrix bostrychoides GSE-TBD4-15B]
MNLSPQPSLRQISVSPNGQAIWHQLSGDRPTVIGSDPNGQIVLDAQQYPGVSRQHVEIRAVQAPNGQMSWQIRDLGSTNGTCINRQPLQGTQILQPGDSIQVGKRGLEFQFENRVKLPQLSQKSPQPTQIAQPAPATPLPPTLYRPAAPTLAPQPPAPQPPARPGTNRVPARAPLADDELRLSQMLPIMGAKQDLLKKGFLIPGVITILLVAGLFASNGRPVLFNGLLSLYLGVAAYYFIYRLSGKPKPWWLLFGSALMTMLILKSPILDLFMFVFRKLLPGGIEQTDFMTALIGNFFGAGMMEELLKVLPVFLALWIGRQLRSPAAERLGVWEPLDGILIATASAVGFTLLETMGQYVPGAVETVSEAAGRGAGELLGLQLLIPRILGSVAGHLAYSGYFGYFIGLSVLKPSKRWTILTIGYITSAALHAFWNASGELGELVATVLGASDWLQQLVGVGVTTLIGSVAYLFLMAAILKARQLSPNRSQNFATQVNFSRLP